MTSTFIKGHFLILKKPKKSSNTYFLSLQLLKKIQGKAHCCNEKWQKGARFWFSSIMNRFEINCTSKSCKLNLYSITIIAFLTWRPMKENKSGQKNTQSLPKIISWSELEVLGNQLISPTEDLWRVGESGEESTMPFWSLHTFGAQALWCFVIIC